MFADGSGFGDPDWRTFQLYSIAAHRHVCVNAWIESLPSSALALVATMIEGIPLVFGESRNR
jgi:hypothetical protein